MLIVRVAQDKLGTSFRVRAARSCRSLVRLKGYTNFDSYVLLTTWTKIAINNTDYNDQGAFDAANNRFVAPVAALPLRASLLYKVNASTTARMNGRLVLNGSTEIKGGKGEISATHVSLATTLTLQTLVPLAPGDTVELQGTSAPPTATSPPTIPPSGAARSGSLELGLGISIGYLTPAAYAATLKPQRASALRHLESSAPMPVATVALMRNSQPTIPVAGG